MKGFVLAHARSGTTWIAEAVTRCTDTHGRHESCRDFGEFRDHGGVESNGNFWRDAEAIRARFPAAGIVHLVRDGRDVVRSKLTHHWGRDPRAAFEMWARWNRRMLRDIPSGDRYRLEDLTTDWTTFDAAMRTLGAGSVDREAWERIRTERVNRTLLTRLYPPFDEWPAERQALFWEVCGDVMEECGYVG